MKVSKALREFIEEQVNIKANQSETILKLKEAADTAKANFFAEYEKLTSEWEAIWNEVVEKYNLNIKFKPSVSCGGANECYLPEVIAYRNAERELDDKKRLAALNIIAEMELGGTKAELMEKLNNLQF